MSRIIRLPPVLFFAFLIAGSVVHGAVPRSLGIRSFRAGMIAGGALLLAAFAIAWAALAELRRHGTTEEPGRRPSALVTGGVFAFSRNPLYVALVTVMAALAVMADSLWLAAGAVLLGVALDALTIRAEEKILIEAFGDEYRDYRRRVRRWL